jgi:hypothetical protein
MRYRWAFRLLGLLLFCIAATAFGQSVGEPSPVDLFDGGTSVYRDWKDLGQLAGIIALMKLLIDVTKIKVIDSWLWDHQWRWVRPTMALLLGGLTSIAIAIPTRANLIVAFIHGALAGASTIGVHELVTMFGDRKVIKAGEAQAIAAHEAEKAEKAA